MSLFLLAADFIKVGGVLKKESAPPLPSEAPGEYCVTYPVLNFNCLLNVCTVHSTQPLKISSAESNEKRSTYIIALSLGPLLKRIYTVTIFDTMA